MVTDLVGMPRIDRLGLRIHGGTPIDVRTLFSLSAQRRLGARLAAPAVVIQPGSSRPFDKLSANAAG